MKVFRILAGVILLSQIAFAEEKSAPPKETSKKVIYPENQTLDFEGLSLEGELKTPGEFYFQNRNQERFDSLTKRRLNFRREMLRDSIQSN
jgi:hypothetical protein